MKDDLTYKIAVTLEDFTDGKIKSIEPIDTVIYEIFSYEEVAIFEESQIKTEEFTIYKAEFERNQIIEFSDGTRIHFIVYHWLNTNLYKYKDLYIVTCGEESVIVIDPTNKTIEYPTFILSEEEC